MAIKQTVPMWTLPSDNEQQVGAGRALSGAGTSWSREYPELGAFSKAIFLLDVSAISGSGASLTVTVQGFNEASGKWHDVVAFAPQTAVSAASPVPTSAGLQQSASLDFTRYRAQWVVAGTSPSVTFTLVAIAHTEESFTRTW